MNGNSDMSMPIEVQDVLRRLEFFALQERNSKPCIKMRTFVDADSWSGMVYRLIHGESCSVTIQELKSMLKEYGACITYYPVYRKLLEDGLERASKGISYLFETYQHKPGVTAELRVIMSMIHILTTNQLDK